MWGQHFPPERLGWNEFILVLIVAFILFGHKLPGIMRTLGRSMIGGPWG